MSSTLPPPRPCGRDAKSKTSQGELRLGDRQSFWAYRVKCLDARESSLRVGKIYTVSAYTSEGLLELKDCKGVYGRWRFEPVAREPKREMRPIGPDLPSTPFQPGDLVRCMDERYQEHGIVAGRSYVVRQVLTGGRAPAMLRIVGCRRPFLACRFDLVDQTRYGLDAYGPAQVPENPIFNAINRRWSNHPSDAALHLNELDRDRR